MSNRNENLKPWPKGVSGNPGGRPKSKPISEEIQRLLKEEAPDSDGKTWAAVIAETLLTRARKGDIRAIAELANRIEGRPPQAVSVDTDGLEGLAEAIETARKRVAEMHDKQVAQMLDKG